MRIAKVNWGCDTGMCLVDVVLESPDEMAMTEAEIWRAMGTVFRAAGIDPTEVVDVFPHILNEQGELKSWPK